MTRNEISTDLLNRVVTRVAETEDDADNLEASLEILDSCRAFSGDTEIAKALLATASEPSDRRRRERDVQYAMTEVRTVKRMMKWL
jgi:hypothetical protein